MRRHAPIRRGRWSWINYVEVYALLGVSYGVEYPFGWNRDPNLSSVTITLALASGESMTSSASVAGQAGVEDPWLGAVPGELPVLLSP